MKLAVRLAEDEIKAIAEVFYQYFQSTDHLWIFGSRADLTKRGGDIDIYIETQVQSLPEIAQRKIKFLVDLKEKIGDQKIDVVVKSLSSEIELPIYKEAREKGIRLL